MARSRSTTKRSRRLRGPLTTTKRKRAIPIALTEQKIVLAALDLLRRDGVERFSMRRLAKELGVTPMAIYYYFGNKGALFQGIGDALLARVPRPAPSGVHWREEAKAAAVRAWELLSEHPGLSAEIVKRPPTQQREELTRYGVSIMVAAGFDARAAQLAIVTCNAFMFGMIGLQAHVDRARGRARKRGARPESEVDMRYLVEFGLDTIMSGVQEPSARKRLAPARAARSTRR